MTNKTTTHSTPGPWKAAFPVGHPPFVSNESIVIIQKVGPFYDAQAKANARLIAKAPEMRALLEEIADRAHSYWKKRARALLAEIGEKNGTL